MIFCRHVKLKAHLKETAGHQHLTEDEIFKKPKNRRTVETFIEATNNDTDAEIKKTKTAIAFEPF